MTTRLPHGAVHVLAYPTAAVAFAFFVWPYRILKKIPALERVAEEIPLKQYANLPFRVCVNDQLDRLSPAFDLLPSDGTIANLEQYTHSGLPLIITENRLEFVLEAIQVRFGDFKSYWQIMKGVERAAAFVRGLRRFVNRPDLADVPGDLAPLVEEMRTLLDHPAFAVLPREGQGELWWWQTLRVDRVLRYDHIDAVDRIVRLVFEIDALVAMASESGSP